MAAASSEIKAPVTAREPTPFRTLALVVGALLICFAKPLFDVLRLSWNEEIHSHIPLVPFISAYLIWIRRTELPRPQRGPLSATFFGLGLAALLLAVPLFAGGLGPIESLSLRLLALQVLLGTAVVSLLGVAFAKAIAFPWAFLIFAVPMPPALINPLEIASQHASAQVYDWMMTLGQQTYFRHADGLHFDLPGLSLQVAQECSGIRSSFVLFMVSLLAGNLFMKTTWRRLALAIFVIPLGLARNGFRIFTLSVLTVHWDRGIIDGPLHHKGGPIFFAISLIPFCLVLAWLCKSERKALNRTPQIAN